MPVRTTREALRAALIDVDFPATKEDLLATAQRNGADEETLRALRSIPPVDYHNMREVFLSVPFADEPPEEAAALKAARRRTHTHPGLAEGSKDV
jgi:hypothetical protein